MIHSISINSININSMIHSISIISVSKKCYFKICAYVFSISRYNFVWQYSKIEPLVICYIKVVIHMSIM